MIPLGDALALFALKGGKDKAFEAQWSAGMVQQVKTTQTVAVDNALIVLWKIDVKLREALEACDGRIAFLKEIGGDLDVDCEIREDLSKEIERNATIIAETELLR